MIQAIQQSERIAEKNPSKIQFRRNSVPSRMRQFAIFQSVTHIRIAAENSTQTQRKRNPRSLATYEILTYLNKPDEYILAICLIDGENVEVRHVRKPFVREPDFGATSVNYDLDKLLAQAKESA